MLWAGIVQRTKQEEDTLIIETVPSLLQAVSSQSTLKMLVYMLLPSLKMYNKNHLNEDSKEFKGKESWAYGNMSSVLSSDVGTQRDF